MLQLFPFDPTEGSVGARILQKKGEPRPPPTLLSPYFSWRSIVGLSYFIFPQAATTFVLQVFSHCVVGCKSIRFRRFRFFRPASRLIKASPVLSCLRFLGISSNCFLFLLFREFCGESIEFFLDRKPRVFAKVSFKTKSGGQLALNVNVSLGRMSQNNKV